MNLRLPLFASSLWLLKRWEGRPWTPHAVYNLTVGMMASTLNALVLPHLCLPWAGPSLLRGLPPAVRLVVGWLALDVAMYWQHRAMHQVPLLWRWHVFHHSDSELNVTSGLRFHGLELFVSRLYKGWVAAVVGLSPAHLLGFEMLLSTASLFHHADLRWSESWEQCLSPWLITPRLHRLHHSLDAAESQHNFGFSTTLWDRAFGTFSDQSAYFPAGLLEYLHTR
jgi:sterol desaturase/sphingolipid hydroxylase (fatty acid hydroxylase superfamily)